MFRLTTLFLLLTACHQLCALPLDKKDIPDPLEPWVDWVLLDNQDITCPFAYNNGKNHRCAWPTRLDLSLNDLGGHFSITWHVYQKSWIMLPGADKQWPTDVTNHGRPISITNKQGKPALILAPGEHDIRGKFSWKQLPNAIQIPKDTGLFSLSINQKPIPFAKNKGGRIWLKQQQNQNKGVEEQLTVEVYRHLNDDLPLRMTSHLDIQVSGKQREVIIGQALLKDAIPLQLISPLPARLEPNGELRVQLRPGRWSIELISRFPEQSNQFDLIKQDKPWPEKEIWSFQAQNSLRLVEPSATTSIDPRQTQMPEQWRQLPAFLLQQGESFLLKTIRRGDPEPEPNKLELHRQLWLDQSGKAYTIQDKINGRMTSGWRLNVNDEFQLGRVLLDQQAQFITQLDNKTGVEVRRGQIQMSADSRYQGDISTLNAVGWQHDFHAVNATLHLPPGWKLFSASGVDTIPHTWINQWTLLDLFMVLIISIAIARLWHWSAGLVSLITLMLIWHESAAPQNIWLHLIAAIALLRALPNNRFRNWVTVYRNLVLITLVIIVVPFMISQVRIGLYPQLALNPSNFGIANNTSIMHEQTIHAEADSVTDSLAQGKSSLSRAAPTAKFYEQAPTRRITKFSQKYDNKTQVQTGPGLPDWRWSSIPLHWNGPVEKTQQLGLTLLSPTMNLILNILRVFLLTLLILIISREFKARHFITAQSNKATATKMIASLILIPLMLISPSEEAHAEIPTPELLAELKTRLLAAPQCLPECAHAARMNMEINKNSLQLRLEIHSLDNIMLPLPGSADNWLPSQIAVNGAPADGLARNGKGQLWIRLTPGVHQLLLFGPLPEQNSIDLYLPLRPQNTKLTAEGWEVSGIDEQGFTQKQLKLHRLHQQQVQQKNLENVTMPPFVRIHRILRMGLDWRMETRLERASPSGTAVVLKIPLLEGESILSDGFRVKDKHLLINLSASDQSIQWESKLNIKPSIILKAAQTNEWVESWSIDVSPIWHMQAEGIAVVHHQNPEGSWLPEWRPWPGESVQLNFSRPSGIEGQTLTIDHSKLTVTPGLRATDVNLKLTARSSQGGQHTITLPEDARLQSVIINGRSQPIRQGDHNDVRKVTIPLIPGKQTLQLHWLQAQGITNLFTTPSIDLGISSVNNHINLQLGQDRWVLFIGGPQWGPAVLIWGVLIVLMLIAIGLGRFDLTPLKTWHWMLLLIGLSQLPIISAALVVAWLLALAAREKVDMSSNKFKFNLSQVALVLLTLVALSSLFEAIQTGLLGSPSMQIAGNNSYASNLNWYQDRLNNHTPQAWIFSLPMMVYRVLMLLWSLWLAFSLIRWLRWGWDCFSKPILWKTFRIKGLKRGEKPVEPSKTDQPNP